MSVRKSLSIAALTRALVFLLSLVSVIIVSRLLTPEEIGVFSVSVSAIALGHVFRDFGVGQYLIQVREVTRERRRAAFTVTLTISWMIAAVLYVSRFTLASFYGNKGVADVMTLLGVNFLILPFAAPLRTLLQREMQFGKLAVVNLANHFVQSATTIGAAWAGESYLSMAWGSIAGNVANVIVLLILSPKEALDWPTHRGLGEVFRFGSKSSIASLAMELGQAAPDLILGRTLGFADVAYLSRARSLVSMALGQLMYVVRSVYSPAFAKGFRDGKDPATLYTETAALLLGLTVPVIALLALLSAPLISLMFGPQWARSAPLGSMICIYALVTAPFALASSSLIASGHVGVMMRCRLVIETMRVFVLLTSAFYALETVVALLGLVNVLEGALFVRALHRTLGLEFRTFWSRIQKSYALVPFTLASPALLLLAARFFGSLPDLWLVSASVMLGFVGWLLGIHLLEHPLKHELRLVVSALATKSRLLLLRGPDR